MKAYFVTPENTSDIRNFCGKANYILEPLVKDFRASQYSGGQLSYAVIESLKPISQRSDHTRGGAAGVLMVSVLAALTLYMYVQDNVEGNTDEKAIVALAN